MGSLAAGEDGDLLKWLGPMVLLVANFKADSSSVHRFYCTTCYSVFFRKKSSSTSSNDSIVICPNSSPNHHHQLHKILQVYLASHAFCIRREDIEAVWNPSDICVYVINNRDIYFIQQKTKSSKLLLGNHHRNRRGYCRICEYKLIQPHTSFCSIECKITELKIIPTTQQRASIQLLEIREADRPANDDEREDESVSIATTIQLYQSLRKRPRKTLHPQRAPLF